MFITATKADVSSDTEPEKAVIEILHYEQGVPREKLKPEASIADDLGVDGDDASELFTRLHEIYGTDFQALSDQWTAFFNNEGMSGRGCFLGLILFVPAIAFSVWLAVTFDLGQHWAGVVTASVFALLWVALARLLPGESKRPVTIAGLAKIVSKGRWPDNPEEVS